MADLLRQYGPPALAWAFVVWRGLLARRHPKDPARRDLWLVLVALALSLTLLTPAVYAFAGDVTGIPNLARLLGHISMLVVAWSAQEFLRRMSDAAARPRTWSARHAGILLAVIAAMVALFALAATPVDDFSWASRYAAHPWILEYWLVYLGYLAPAFAHMALLGWRYARVTTDAVLSLGLRLVAVGALGGLAYHVHRALSIAGQRLGFGYLPPGEFAVDALLPLAANTLVLVGATMPAWGRWAGVADALDWLRRHRAYGRLRPLWLALYTAVPQIALAPPAPALLDLLPRRDLRLRLYRRVVEIRDGRLALQPYLDPAVTAAARDRALLEGVREADVPAVAEAVTLATAVRASRDREPVAPTAALPVPGGADLDSDIDFLVRVARAYRHADPAGLTRRRRPRDLPARAPAPPSR
ncbi:hypothetical protein Aph01nite_48830 [Acrocarpospora phusangensis]|uniref:DUF6545 domain-containing protein n=1 Tax=Acrocarpospora phusangensis TaxID=1070424 RepID=A0A919QD83_9ACTN|nr:MAB_1171c family putative transporter [Acrocarpospora phusangensis]GIH26573.1 hypothetical protein Aph01nite_48830 [Acrocarpospora phusangensis]